MRSESDIRHKMDDMKSNLLFLHILCDPRETDAVIKTLEWVLEMRDWDKK